MAFGDVVETIGKVVDAAGVATIVLGALLATWFYLTRVRTADVRAGAYQAYRQALGRAILLGLEFLVAADIIRTVAIAPTFSSLGILAIIVAIRTFLSLELEMEIEGRWPWQRPRPLGESAVPPPVEAERRGLGD